MKKEWKDPVKNPPKESTMQIQGDFSDFTALMSRVVNKKPDTTVNVPESFHSTVPAS
jgi:hypothetical protein